MELIFKSVSFGFLLRSLFSGAFFVISYRFVGGETTFRPESMFSVVLPIALLAGVTVYGLHRSLIYPLIEWGMVHPAVAKWRTEWPLITEETIRTLQWLWFLDANDSNQRKKILKEHHGKWADYIHQQYTSSLCVVCGVLACVVTGQYNGGWLFFLLIVALFFAVAAVVAEWRLRSLLDYIRCDPRFWD